MENVKKYFLFAACFAAILFVPPSVSAQNNTSGKPAQNADAGLQDEDPSKSETKTERSLWVLVKTGGAVMVALAALALYGFYKAGVQVYVIVFSNDASKDERLLSDLSVPPDQMAGVLEEEINKRDKGAFPRVCEAALEESHAGKSAMEEALVQEGTLQLGALKRGLRPLQIVVAVAPLLGLLGTVYGMISSFQSVEVAGVSGDKVELLSRGIYEALVTTATGLTIAIPFLFVSHWLNRKTDEIGVNLNRHSKVFLKIFASNGRGIADAESQHRDSDESAGESQTVLT